MGFERPGNRPARALVERLSPRLVLCGHLHMPLAARLPTAAGHEAIVVGLDRVTRGGVAAF